MLLSAVSVLVVAQSSSEIPEGHMNNLVYPIYVFSQQLMYNFKTFLPKFVIEERRFAEITQALKTYSKSRTVRDTFK